MVLCGARIENPDLTQYFSDFILFSKNWVEYKVATLRRLGKIKKAIGGEIFSVF